MNLNVLDIEEFVTRNNVKQVTSFKLYKGSNKIDPEGLLSEDIFGRLGSKQRRTTFGYIDLKTKFIHPEVYPILSSLSSDLPKLLISKQNYSIKDGILVEDNDKGDSGILFFIKNYKNIDLDKITKPEKQEELEFIKKNKDKIFIDKILVLPAGIRDAQFTSKSGKISIQISEITEIYAKLISQTNLVSANIIDETSGAFIYQNVQRVLLDINEWIKNRMKGKQGLIRSGILKKVTDYSARLVITPDSTLPLGYVGMPWQIATKLFELFFINHVLKKDKTVLSLIQNYLKLDNTPDLLKLRRFIGQINSDVNSIDSHLKEILKNTITEIVKDKVIVYKRDPVENRDSWICSKIRIDDTGYTLKINQFDCNRHGGDFLKSPFV